MPYFAERAVCDGIRYLRKEEARKIYGKLRFFCRRKDWKNFI